MDRTYLPPGHFLGNKSRRRLPHQKQDKGVGQEMTGGGQGGGGGASAWMSFLSFFFFGAKECPLHPTNLLALCLAGRERGQGNSSTSPFALVYGRAAAFLRRVARALLASRLSTRRPWNKLLNSPCKEKLGRSNRQWGVHCRMLRMQWNSSMLTEMPPPLLAHAGNVGVQH